MMTTVVVGGGGGGVGGGGGELKRQEEDTTFVNNLFLCCTPLQAKYRQLISNSLGENLDKKTFLHLNVSFPKITIILQTMVYCISVIPYFLWNV